MKTRTNHPSSFRDPSGYIFKDNGVFKRRILPEYFDQYSSLKEKLMYQELFDLGFLIKHKEEKISASEIIIEPQQIPFFTYPYEWSFLQYKEAALLTLKLHKYCLENNFSLKDASAFNVSFVDGKAIFIDTLSIDFYEENKPWRAYKQFITHFLGPLLLAKYHGANSLKLLSNFIDGVPIQILSSMLPSKTKLNPFIYSHIHLLSKFDKKYNQAKSSDKTNFKLSKNAQFNIINSLYNFIKKLSLNENSEWGDYYNITNYSHTSFQLKSKIIDNWINEISPKTLIDVGGNNGMFVRQIKNKPELALVCDIDNNAVDANYKSVKLNKESWMLPFIMDVLNPSAGIGFRNKERDAIIDRIKALNPDITLALALVHHLSISANLSFQMIAAFFHSFSNYLIIEFPKRNDSWVEHLLDQKGKFKEQFDAYNLENFRNEFSFFFEVIEEIELKNSERVMFFLRKKQ